MAIAQVNCALINAEKKKRFKEIEKEQEPKSSKNGKENTEKHTGLLRPKDNEHTMLPTKNITV